ncbi:MAG: hypothetical protein C4531_03950 [Desulfurivibrio sp.]|nr:MAG: hypothetical protein C4531_03950 [Desulfurivibrio sp.]
MKQTSLKIMQGIALLACGFIGVQIAMIIFSGKALCLNDGCSIAEKLTTVAPVYLNLSGFVYFLAVFLVCRWSGPRTPPAIDWLRLLLLIGLAVEGVLVSYQVFVIHALCSYCLIIFSFIVLLNVLYGRQQLFIGIPLFGAVLAAFTILNFGPTLLTLQNQTLASGTLAVRKCAQPLKQLYFFFSSDCPHCKNVLQALENCNSCEFHFNPIDKIKSMDMPELEYSPTYNPALNRLILSLVKIETIPVLLVQNPDGLTFIKGEESIIRFISQTCFREEPQLYLDSSLYNAPQGMSVYDEQQGECNIQLDCPDAEKQTEGSAGPATFPQSGTP